MSSSLRVAVFMIVLAFFASAIILAFHGKFALLADLTKIGVGVALGWGARLVYSFCKMRRPHMIRRD